MLEPENQSVEDGDVGYEDRADYACMVALK